MVDVEIKRSGATDTEVISALVNSRTRISESGEVEVLDDAGNPRITYRDGKVTNITVSELMDEIKVSKPALFTKMNATGGVDFSGPNPFSKKNFSLTKQMLMERTNPALAAQLRDQAE